MTFFEKLNKVTEKEQAELEDLSFIEKAIRGGLSRRCYVAFLTQAYHHEKHTVPLLMTAGAGIPRRLHWLKNHLVEYISEGKRHDDCILNDIEACGGNAKSVRAGSPFHVTETMVTYLYNVIHFRNPVSILGMLFVLERAHSLITTKIAGGLQNSLQLPYDAFTYLTLVGKFEQQHSPLFKTVVNRLDDDLDRQAVIHTAKGIYCLYGDVLRALPVKVTSSRLYEETGCRA